MLCSMMDCLYDSSPWVVLPRNAIVILHCLRTSYDVHTLAEQPMNFSQKIPIGKWYMAVN